MKVVIDVEANALHNPTVVWCIVCKDIDKGEYHVFEPFKDELELGRFRTFDNGVGQYIGHNIIGWDNIVLNKLCGVDLNPRSLDTLILSKLIDYPRDGHSIEDYGKQFGLEKGLLKDFSKYSEELLEYCKRDVDISHRIYDLYKRYVSNSKHSASIRTEHDFQIVVNKLNDIGFAFDTKKATKLLETVQGELSKLDKEIQDAFRRRLVPIREITPRVTKFGTLNRSDFRWLKSDDLSEYNGGPFVRCAWKDFNPSSHRQVVDVLSGAGWKPTAKTKTHIEANRRGRIQDSGSDPRDLAKYGWRINEENLATLPDRAPRPARTLAQRILLEARRRTLTEWLGLVRDDDRIHGKFYSIGAWTHRMAHQNPNTANIPTGHKLYGERMRALWRAPNDRLLVGVDAEGIQLRIFAHYINDEEFTNAILSGRKSDGSDPHSLNQRILGTVCKSRDNAKRWIYAFLLGAGQGKLREILGCSGEEAGDAYNRLVQRYTGLRLLQSTVIPTDAKRGWFSGLDGRRVRIPGDNANERRHLAMSGYLQNGEAVIMKMACLKWWAMLPSLDSYLVNFVHDEWQTEVPNNLASALQIAKLQADSLYQVGEELKLRCPLAGSYWSDSHKDYSIGINWSQTH